MCRWLNSKGEIIKTRTIREFADRYGLTIDSARNLHSGHRSRIRGFCSLAPRAKKERDRFMMVLVNTKSGERSILGPSVKQFAKDRGLSLQGLSELVNGTVFVYRHWVLAKTLDAISSDMPVKSFQKHLPLSCPSF